MNCSFLTLVRQLSSQSQRVSAIPLSVQLRLPSSPISSAISSSSSSIFSRSSALSNNFQHRAFTTPASPSAYSGSGSANSPSSSSYDPGSGMSRGSGSSGNNSTIFGVNRSYVYGSLAALVLVLYLTGTFPFHKKNKNNTPKIDATIKADTPAKIDAPAKIDTPAIKTNIPEDKKVERKN